MKATSLVCFLLMLCGLFLQSCISFIPEASIDMVRHKFKGPSFGDNTNGGYNLGVNLAFFYLLGGDAFRGPGSPRAHTYRQAASANLLASSSRQLSFGVVPPPEPTSFFKSDKFALMPGLELVSKGNKISDSFGTDITRLLYLEIPIYALYRHYLPDNKGELFGGLGPYFGYALTGKFKSTFNGQTFESSAFDANNGGLKRFDAGLAFTVGYQFPSSLRLRLGYELGLANIQVSGFDDKTYNRALSLNVGYPLAKIVDKFKKK